jgi:hypothetical protein
MGGAIRARASRRLWELPPPPFPVNHPQARKDGKTKAAAIGIHWGLNFEEDVRPKFTKPASHYGGSVRKGDTPPRARLPGITLEVWQSSADSATDSAAEAVTTSASDTIAALHRLADPRFVDFHRSAPQKSGIRVTP